MHAGGGCYRRWTKDSKVKDLENVNNSYKYANEIQVQALSASPVLRIKGRNSIRMLMSRSEHGRSWMDGWLPDGQSVAKWPLVTERTVSFRVDNDRRRVSRRMWLLVGWIDH